MPHEPAGRPQTPGEARDGVGRRPRLLDLFCGAGGAAMGYHRAGFDVVGVDIKPQPHYPFEFVQADALTFPLEGFDAIHASPPCQGYSTGTRSDDAKATPRLLAETRARLMDSSVPYVIENVHGARAEMRATSSGYLTLCGSMFGGDHARRHRLFETVPFIWQPYHPDCRGWNLRLAQRLGVGWRDVQAVGHGRGKRSKVWPRVLGIDWANDYGMSQAIPPAYTEWLGRQLIAAIAAERAA